MHLNIEEILYYKNTPKKTEKKLPQHQLYNLLFAGKMDMKEYLKALRSIKDETKKEE